ncbi:MAG: zf-HC2 domain-containing protein [Dehalococcoidales bacterium]|nr:zf-HC2 domain-containing protein [Dehalococcoidales bacterium]
MNCRDFEEMLSAYASGELSPAQREIIERHLTDCADCRTALSDFQKVRQQVSSLKADEPTIDIKDAAMAKIKSIAAVSPAKRRLRRSLAVVPAAVAVVLLAVLQPWNSFTPENMIAKAQAAIANLQSYRFSAQSVNSNGEYTETQIEFSAPDRYHFIQTGNGGNQEFILIEDKLYYKDVPPFQLVRGAQLSAASLSLSDMLTREATAKLLDYLIDVNNLTDDTVDETDCLHYRGTFDHEKELREMWLPMQEMGIHPPSDEAMEEMLAECRSSGRSTTIELWIGKDDHLIRKMIIDDQTASNNGETQSSIKNFRFYDFNQPVIIEAPVDSGDNLLSGWFSTSPEYPHIGADIQTEVNNYDPSNRRVNYSITLTNIATETLKDVDFRFCFIPSNPDSKIWVSWDSEQTTSGPFTLSTGESLNYSCTFGYDATSISPETISETIENSYVEMEYLAPDGQKKSELFHFEAPQSLYTLPTDIPPYLTTVELIASGEYRIEESGATYADCGTTGEIDGKEYLFIQVNTGGAETPTPPGILILDIQDKDNPRKTTYISIDGDSSYIRCTALYGTVLYVSTSDSLRVFDVSEPVVPVELSRLSGLHPTQMVISGEYAFIYDGNNGIITLDLEDPANPEEIGFLPLSSLNSVQLYTYGNYLFTEIDDILYTIDISTPSSLRIVSEYSFGTYHVTSISLSNDYAYVALYTDDTSGISVLDISDPANPRKIAFLELKDQKLWGLLFASGERVYVLTANRYGVIDPTKWKIVIIDISNPAQPVQLGYGILPDPSSFFDYTYGGYTFSHYGIGHYLYWFIGNSPNSPVIEIIDLSEP